MIHGTTLHLCCVNKSQPQTSPYSVCHNGTWITTPVVCEDYSVPIRTTDKEMTSTSRATAMTKTLTQNIILVICMMIF